MICPYCLATVGVFHQKRTAARNNYRCEHCDSEIPVDYATSGTEVPQIVVSLIGKTGHGKSCFLSAFLESLDTVARSNRTFYYKGLDEVEFRKLRQKREQLRKGMLPEPTAPSARPSPLLLEVNNIGGVSRCQLMMYDVAGAAYNDPEILSEKARFVIHSNCVIWLLSIDDIESPFDLDEFLSVYLSALSQMQSDSNKQSLVVAITKGDRLLSRNDVPNVIKESLSEDIDPVSDDGHAAIQVSDAIENWLSDEIGASNFVRLAASEFRSVRYCVLSSLGSEPQGSSLEWQTRPRGVLAPLLWVLRESLPTIRLIYRGDRQRIVFSVDDALAEMEVSAEIQRIEVASGTFRIKKPISIRRPVGLIGQGMDKTIIEVESPMRFESGGSKVAITVLDLGIQYVGGESADTCIAASGAVRLTNCRLSGAKYDPGKGIGGAGLRVTQGASARLEGCKTISNGRAGIIAENAACMVLRSETSENKHSGALFIRCQKVVVSKVEANGNGHSGLEVRDCQEVKISECMARGNSIGIVLADSSAGSILQNTCEHNKDAGILVADSSEPLLEQNLCNGNKQSGIRFADGSSGKVVENTCDANGQDGIHILSGATPDLNGNRCRRNSRFGIHLEKNSVFSLNSSRVTNSECHGNEAEDIADRRHSWTKPF